MTTTIYLVDDDDAVRESLAASLTSVGFSVQAFSTPDELLLRPPSDRRGCIVTDHDLAGMTGLDLATELARRDVRLPIILMSGRPTSEIDRRARHLGVRAVLQKPFTRDQLVAAIRTSVENS